jgi:hypothetical protein
LSKYIGKADGTAERVAGNSTSSVLEAPDDGKQYVRKNKGWEEVDIDDLDVDFTEILADIL